MTNARESSSITNAKLIVIKIGSNPLTVDGESLRYDWIKDRAAEISKLISIGKQVVIVTSGAVAAGAACFGRKPRSLPEKQAFAAVGQSALMRCYEEAFSTHSMNVAQVLLTNRDIHDHYSRLDVRDTLGTLLHLGVIPIVNENDSVGTDELRFGDNDRLAAYVVDLVNADLLILLSDVDGLFNDDPNASPDASLIPVVQRITPEIMRLAKRSTSEFGTGGMITKLEAARMATGYGCQTIITNGFRDNPILEVFKGGPVGTLFLLDDDRPATF